MIEIPYWWDKRFETLVATVHAQRPDLFTGTPIADPIPSIAPKTSSTRKTHRIMTATVWNKEESDPTGW